MTSALVISDLHLLFANFRTDVVPDFTIIAGDSCEKNLAKNTYTKLLNKGHRILFVCGNHEYCGNRFDAVNEAWQEFDNQNENFHFLNNETITIDGQRFCGTTLWGNVPRELESLVVDEEDGLNDFKYIYLESPRKPITPKEYNSLNKKSISFLEENLMAEDILITHHAPHSNSVPEKYKFDPLKCCYVSDISSLILDRKPKIAVHGHMHTSSNYMIGDTRVIANPRGYVGSKDGSNSDFDKNLVIEF